MVSFFYMLNMFILNVKIFSPIVIFLVSPKQGHVTPAQAFQFMQYSQFTATQHGDSFLSI